MIRTFKYVALTTPGVPQPCFGTTTSAAIAPASAGTNSQVSIPVTDSSFFQPQDPVNVDVGVNEERTLVVSVPDGTHIVVASLSKAHASGIFVRLTGPISAVYIQCIDGNTSAIFIGNKSTMVKATGVGCIAKLQPVASGTQPIEFDSTIAGFPGPLSYGELWFDGTTAGDKILPSASVD